MNLVEAHSTCSLSLLFLGFVQNLCAWFHSITYTYFFLYFCPLQKKSTLNTAVSQFCPVFTEVVGTFLVLPCWTHIIATRILITCLANDIKLLTRLLINCLTHNLPHTHNK
jgi:hypothetical protein